MRRLIILGAAASAVLLAPAAPGQATGTPTFNAPYRAFTRSEVGLLISFPNGGGTAFEGAYRMSSGKLDVGVKGGIFDPDGAGDAILLIGAEGRQRVLTHNADFPLDGAVVVGVGGQFVSGGSLLLVPVGLSLGRRIDFEGSTISMVPYIQPTLLMVFDGGSDVVFAVGLGADFRLTPRFDARIAAGLGDIEGVSLGAVWVH